MGVDAREGRESVWICVRVSLQRPETDRLDQFFYFTERNGDGLALTGVKLDLAFAGEPAECGNGFISLQSRDLRNLRDGQAFVTVFSKGGPEQSGRFSDSLFVDDRLFFFSGDVRAFWTVQSRSNFHEYEMEFISASIGLLSKGLREF